MAPIVRYLGVLGLAIWLGGVAFYGAVVIPAAHDVLNSHREIGFVTRTVTGTANAAGFVTLAVLLANLVMAFPRASKATRITLATSLAVMVLAQATLFILRRSLEGMLDPIAMTISDRGRFMPLHERYLNVTAALCLAGAVHLWTLLAPTGSKGAISPRP
jgi:hypothetical protein